jgi:hypothetical protein
MSPHFPVRDNEDVSRGDKHEDPRSFALRAVRIGRNREDRKVTEERPRGVAEVTRGNLEPIGNEFEQIGCWRCGRLRRASVAEGVSQNTRSCPQLMSCSDESRNQDTGSGAQPKTIRTRALSAGLVDVLVSGLFEVAVPITDRVKIMFTHTRFVRASGVNFAAQHYRERFMRSDLRRVFLTILATTVVSASAFAGFRTAQQVVIMDEKKFANADVGYVHQTSDDVQYIGCFVAGDAGYCFAQNMAGVTRSCWSDDPKFVRAMAAVSDDTYLIFYWNAGGYCTSVSARNGSSGERK